MVPSPLRTTRGREIVGKLPAVMDRVRSALVILEVVVAILLMTGVLIQTPKSTGLGGTIGGGDSGLGGGYRTRRGPEGPVYFTTRGVNADLLALVLPNIL